MYGHFVMGNICLNDLSINHNCTPSQLDICIVHGDIYKPITQQNQNQVENANCLSPGIGVFNQQIFSNPPFVDISKTN